MLKFFYFSANFKKEKKIPRKNINQKFRKKILIYPILGPDEDGTCLKFVPK